MNLNPAQVATLTAVGVTVAATCAPLALRGATNEPPAQAVAPVGEWRKLFDGDAWYKAVAGDEQVFSGTLEALKPPAISTLQRNSFYKLGDRTIRTGVRRVPALDALVGRKVEIRGKAVDMELEGRQLHEICPAAVRAAPGGAAP